MTNILTQKINSDVIEVSSLNCKNLKINNCVFNETVGFLCINGISLPFKKSNLISNFNIQSITTLYFTLKNGYRIDLVDLDDNILLILH